MWSDPGVTQQIMLLDNPIQLPGANGGIAMGTFQRAGFLKRLRMLHTTVLAQSAATGAPSKSAFGPLAGALNHITISANGQIPLIDLSGLGATLYNEIQNRDGSVTNRPSIISEINITEAAKLAQYDAPATGVVTYTAQYPFEFQFALPVNIRQQVTELGLWLLQGQSIDLAVTLNFNPPYSASATPNAVYSGGTGVTATPTLASCLTQFERELYEVPQNSQDMPNVSWAHQVIEFPVPFTSNYMKFDLPKAGLLLRAILMNLDGSNNPVEYTDVSQLAWTYGANTRPIARPGWGPTLEYLQDYGRMPFKGVQVLDFYKWGDFGLKLVKNTELLANLRIEENFRTTASGTTLVILDRLIPVVNQ